MALVALHPAVLQILQEELVVQVLVMTAVAVVEVLQVLVIPEFGVSIMVRTEKAPLTFRDFQPH
jgi:hypothetical protein